MKNVIDFIYTLVIGAGVALFVGLGIWTFYSGPKFPEYPNYSYYNEPSESEKQKYETEQKAFDKKMKEHDKIADAYNRNVSAIALGAGIVAFLVGMMLIKKNDIIGEGLALGGIITTVYSAGRGVVAQTRPLVFAAVTVILVMAILLALTRRDTFVLSKLKRSKK